MLLQLRQYVESDLCLILNHILIKDGHFDNLFSSYIAECDFLFEIVGVKIKGYIFCQIQNIQDLDVLKQIVKKDPLPLT